MIQMMMMSILLLMMMCVSTVTNNIPIFNRYQLPYEVVVEGDDEIETEDGNLYTLTPTEDWTLPCLLLDYI
jgi:hypothetical protein